MGQRQQYSATYYARVRGSGPMDYHWMTRAKKLQSARALTLFTRKRTSRSSRGALYHPETQGKIARWHQTLKNRILLANYYLPDDRERQIPAFV